MVAGVKCPSLSLSCTILSPFFCFVISGWAMRNASPKEEKRFLEWRFYAFTDGSPFPVVASFPNRLRRPCRPPRIRNAGCTAAPCPNAAPTSVGFWASRSWHARPGLHLRSVLQLCLRLPPHAASRRPDHLATLRLRAVPFGLWLLPTRSTEDFHLLSRVHA